MFSHSPGCIPSVLFVFSANDGGGGVTDGITEFWISRSYFSSVSFMMQQWTADRNLVCSYLEQIILVKQRRSEQSIHASRHVMSACLIFMLVLKLFSKLHYSCIMNRGHDIWGFSRVPIPNTEALILYLNEMSCYW